ncbi:MAG TPA: cation transporter dimerization domain-containing protein [Candidatus Megaira endosymbiont of Hartmannula sinica]|nr:cation transporter dimerization domain-containing protein [Candidatus Megaera endosymbiont of Hartmannula sinica]
MYGSYGLFKSSLKNLVDEEFEEEDKKRLIEIISNCNDIKGIHELKTRWAGNKPFIQFHLELDQNLYLKEAHNISVRITRKIKEKFKGAEVIIHQDIFGDEENVAYREKI